MLTWAIERGHITANHLRGFRRLYHADRSEIIWLPEHVAAFMAVAPIEMQRAMILALHTGQRQGDLLRLPWSAYDGSIDHVAPRQSATRQITGVHRSWFPAPLRCAECSTAWNAPRR